MTKKEYVVLTPKALDAMRSAVASMLASQAGGDFTEADLENGHCAQRWLNSLPSRPVIVALTPAEAEELSFAVGNSLHDPEEWKSYLGSSARLARAQSAQDKLIQSKAGRGT